MFQKILIVGRLSLSKVLFAGVLYLVVVMTVGCFVLFAAYDDGDGDSEVDGLKAEMRAGRVESVGKLVEVKGGLERVEERVGGLELEVERSVEGERRVDGSLEEVRAALVSVEERLASLETLLEERGRTVLPDGVGSAEVRRMFAECLGDRLGALGPMMGQGMGSDLIDEMLGELAVAEGVSGFDEVAGLRGMGILFGCWDA